MFVFGLIRTILRAQTRKFWEKEGKNVLKNDGKVLKKYVFVRKRYRNIRILNMRLARLCENSEAMATADFADFAEIFLTG